MRGTFSGRYHGGPGARLTGLIVVSLIGFSVLTTMTEVARGQDERPHLVCSTTQVADFARQVVGDRWQVVSILAAGQDPHLYEVTPNDSRKVRQATLCLENGLHLEGSAWMSRLARNEDRPIVTCAQGVMPLQLATANGDETVADPHAWFTPLNAAVYVRNIVRGVAEIDTEHQAEYESRGRLYLEQLRTLHAWIRRECNRIPESRRVLVTSHDAFNYFCAEYGFRTAAPVGWSTGKEVGAGITPARRRATVESIREFRVPAIFVETSVNPELIQQIAQEAGVEIGGKLYSDSMGAPGTAGETYLGMMRENVLTIVAGLSE
ncbi:MAG: zinc ABC transporter substrate-binding protein [Planctomycetales bacterium]|nr:zinc ABC transporter substrate-binding protein [Planctomycetales bacterium]